MEGPMGCSTPRPGVNGISAVRSVMAANGPPWDVEALMKRVVAELNQEEKELVEELCLAEGVCQRGPIKCRENQPIQADLSALCGRKDLHGHPG